MTDTWHLPLPDFRPAGLFFAQKAPAQHALSGWINAASPGRQACIWNCTRAIRSTGRVRLLFDHLAAELSDFVRGRPARTGLNGAASP